MQINATLIGQAIGFLVLVWFTWRFVWPPLLTAIEERQKKIADGLAAADRGQKDLDEARAKAGEILREAQAKAQQIVDQANRRSNEMVDEAKNVAHSEGERIKSQARADVANESQRARDGLRSEVSKLAVAGASQLLGREVDAKAHADLLDQLAAQIAQR